MEDGRWHRERPALTRLCAGWTEELARAGVPAGTLTIEIEPAAEPRPGVVWNWWVYFSLGDFTLDAMVAGGLEAMAFENEAGYFDDHVTPGEAADYLLARARGLPFRPRRPGRRRRRP